ncbi:MAG: hypothetical protein ACYCT2_06495 [Thermoplasmataceae archaeon]
MIRVRTYRLPKLGNSDEECEDAFSSNGSFSRMAIADGASDSIFSGVWASSLVDQFALIEGRLYDDKGQVLNQLITAARNSWYDRINWKKLSLFVKNKAIKGSFSTFLGVEIEKTPEGYITYASAVGDSCLITKNDGAIHSVPINVPSDFNSTPQLIWSGYGAPFSREFKWKKPVMQKFAFNFAEGSTFMLATDALSKWMLEHRKDSWETLINAENPGAYFDLLRKRKEMRNDDVTLAIVTLGP